MSAGASERPIELLLVEDNPADVRLTREALRGGKVRSNLYVVEDGDAAIAFAQREGKYAGAPRPDLILLDLNLPGTDGREVLASIKGDGSLRRIPVVVLTASQAEEDVVAAYRLQANCYVTKPVDFEQYADVVKAVEEFWLTIVKLPRG